MDPWPGRRGQIQGGLGAGRESSSGLGQVFLAQMVNAMYNPLLTRSQPDPRFTEVKDKVMYTVQATFSDLEGLEDVEGSAVTGIRGH